MKRGRAIWQAYADVGALKINCPNCEAGVGTWCTREGGKVRRVPCIARAAAGGLIVAAPRGHHDFGEPRHPRTEEAP